MENVMNLGSLLEQIDPYLKKGVNRCCFRGQAQQWPILPKEYRHQFAGSANEFVWLADSRLSQWEAESLTYLHEIDAVPKSPWDLLAVAQHFGLATRAADWTSNPLVALFFAVSSHEESDGELIIWSFESSSYNNKSLPPAEVKSVVLFRPAPTFARLRFQQGLLSYHPVPESTIPDEQLFRILIPAADKIPLQNQLHRFGVDHETIFVSPDHLAEKINWISTNSMRKA
jgi:hypothetical protein